MVPPPPFLDAPGKLHRTVTGGPDLYMSFDFHLPGTTWRSQRAAGP